MSQIGSRRCHLESYHEIPVNLPKFTEVRPAPEPEMGQMQSFFWQIPKGQWSRFLSISGISYKFKSGQFWRRPQGKS